MTANRKLTLAEAINAMGFECKLSKKEVSTALKSYTQDTRTGPAVCDKDKRTPFMCAVINGNIPVLEWIFTPYMMNNDGNPGWDEIDSDGMTAFMHAVNYSDLNSAEKKEDKTVSKQKRKETLLFLMNKATRVGLGDLLKLFAKLMETMVKRENMDCYDAICEKLNFIFTNYEKYASARGRDYNQYYVNELREQKNKILKFFESLFLLAVESNCTRMTYKIWQAYSSHTNFHKLTDTQLLICSALQQGHTWMVYALLTWKFPFQYPKNFITQVLQLQKQAKQEEFYIYKEIYNLFNGDIYAEDLVLASNLTYNKWETLGLLVDKLGSVTTDGHSILTMMLTIQQKASAEDYTFFKEKYFKYRFKFNVITKNDLKHALALPHNANEIFVMLLRDLNGLDIFPIKDIIAAWQENGNKLPDLVVLLTNEINTHPKILTLALEAFKQNEASDQMEQYVKERLSQKCNFNMEHLEIASECQNKSMLKILLQNVRQSSVNPFDLPPKLALAAWQHPQAALRFKDIEIEHKSASSTLTALLQNYFKSKTDKTIEITWPDVTQVIDTLYAKKLTSISNEDWKLALEIAEEPLLLKLIKWGTGDILALFELALRKKNPKFINLIIDSQDTILGDFLQLALNLDHFTVLRKLFTCKIQINNKLNIVPLFNFYQQAQNDPALQLSLDDVFYFLDEFCKLKISFTAECFSAAIKINEAKLIDYLIQVFKAQKSPSLSTLLSCVIDAENDELIEVILQQGAYIEMENWISALSHPVIFDLLLKYSDCKNLEALRYLADKGSVDCIKKLLDKFVWPAQDILEVRKTIWESKQENQQRIDKILFYSNKTLKDVQQLETEFTALPEVDQEFILKLIGKRNPVRDESTLPQKTEVAHEPQLEQKLETPFHPSAPPLNILPDASLVSYNKDIVAVDLNPQSATVLPVVAALVAQEAKNHEAKPIPPAIVFHLETERQIEGVPNNRVELNVSSQPSAYSINNLFAAALTNERKRQMMMMFLNATPACLDLWKDDPAALAVFKQLNQLCWAEFQKTQKLSPAPGFP